VARLLGDQRQDHEAEVAVFQEASDPTAAMAAMVFPDAFAHAAAPGMTAAVFVPAAEEVMVSVHIKSPLL
jgi:hypothetical protein